MENPQIDPWLAAYQFSVFLASVIVWVQLFARWRSRGLILGYEPRLPVPWGAVAIVPPIAFLLLALWSGEPQGIPADDVAVDASSAIANLLASIFLQALLVALVVGVAVMSGATKFDLGFPESPRQLASDVGLGVVTCLAAVAPVHTVQLLLLSLMGREEPSHHPLVKMLTGGEANFLLLIVASTTAVIVAPLCEEIIYRLMLQGWLEKSEDERATPSRAVPAENSMMPSDSPTDVALDDEAQKANKEFSELDSSSTGERPSPGLFGLPHGWFPIVVSSGFFAVAHAGYGPEPVPIFLLALIFGYVYQRTHRIVPTIVAHSLFNLITMIALWRLVFHSAE